MIGGRARQAPITAPVCCKLRPGAAGRPAGRPTRLHSPPGMHWDRGAPASRAKPPPPPTTALPPACRPQRQLAWLLRAVLPHAAQAPVWLRWHQLAQPGGAGAPAASRNCRSLPATDSAAVPGEGSRCAPPPANHPALPTAEPQGGGRQGAAAPAEPRRRPVLRHVLGRRRRRHAVLLPSGAAAHAHADAAGHARGARRAGALAAVRARRHRGGRRGPLPHQGACVGVGRWAGQGRLVPMDALVRAAARPAHSFQRSSRAGPATATSPTATKLAAAGRVPVLPLLVCLLCHKGRRRRRA